MLWLRALQKAPRTRTLFTHVCRWIRGRERRRWRRRCILWPFLCGPSDSAHTLDCPSPAECQAAYEFVCVRHVVCCCLSGLDAGPALPGSRRAASPSKTRLTQQWKAAWCNYPAASWDVPGKNGGGTEQRRCPALLQLIADHASNRVVAYSNGLRCVQISHICLFNRVTKYVARMLIGDSVTNTQLVVSRSLEISYKMHLLFF